MEESNALKAVMDLVLGSLKKFSLDPLLDKVSQMIKEILGLMTALDEIHVGKMLDDYYKILPENM